MSRTPSKAKPARAKPKARAPEPAPSERVTTTVEEGAIRSPAARATTRRLERMLDALDLQRVEVSLALVSDETIADLNRRYRKKNKPTDVLSFPLIEAGTAAVFEAAATADVLLGDIVVSVPTAQRQADERERSLADEITTLVAHGLLHLLGFDHGSDDDEREMDAYVRVLEAAAMNKKPLQFRLALAESVVAGGRVTIAGTTLSRRAPTPPA